MKKFFITISLIASVILINGCGATSEISNNPYAVEGIGTSMNKSRAYDMAFDDAILKIAKKSNRSVDEVMEQVYNNTSVGRKRQQEQQTYHSVAHEKTNADLFDVVTGKPRYRRKGGQYTCTIVAKVSPENVQ